MRIWKNALILSVIASLLLSAFVMTPSRANGTTMLSVDSISNADLTPGETFTINVYVWDVEDMWGFNFWLYFDNSVIITTAYQEMGENGKPIFYNAGGYDPFFEGFKLLPENDYGRVGIGLSYITPPDAPPVEPGGGWYWTGPYAIAWIQFEVVGMGSSMLTIGCDSTISDPIGNAIPHGKTAGFFTNMPGNPIAGFSVDPEEPVASQQTTFTSTSIDTDGYIVEWYWDFGDGATVTTTTDVSVYHTYPVVDAYLSKDYTVTLTVTDNDGKTDSLPRLITVKPPTKLGAVQVKVWGSQKNLDFSRTGEHKQILKVQVVNLDPVFSTYIRPTIEVRSAPPFINHPTKSPIEFPPVWIEPNTVVGKNLFQSDAFDMFAPGWGFIGQSGITSERVTDKEFVVTAKIYYMDFWLVPPGQDPEHPEGIPHWTTVEPIPTIEWYFWCHEDKAVSVAQFIPTEDPLTWTFDGTQSYDPDAKWGDTVAEQYWFVFDDVEFNNFYYLGGAVTHCNFYDAFMYIYENYGLTTQTFTVMHRCVDLFGVRRNVYYWSAIEITYVPPP